MRHFGWTNVCVLALLLIMSTGCPPEADDDSADDDTTGDDDDTTGDDQVPLGTTFAGETTLTHMSEGVVECSASLDLTGTAYTGNCVDCEFAFQIDSTVIEQSGEPDCILDHAYYVFNSGWYDSLHFMAYAGTFVYGSTTYTSAFLAGLSYGEKGSDYPYWIAMTANERPDTSFGHEGQDISWEYYQSYQPYGVDGYVRITGSGTIYP